MLDSLAAVDWSRLEHAYGPAIDVPDMLRGLASPDPDTREEAWEGLNYSVTHLGTI